MKIVKDAIAGTLESCDIQIMLLSNPDKGIEIELKSSVEKQYGKQIRRVIMDTLSKLEVDNVKIVATDKGALDLTIKSRVACAVYRACDVAEDFAWEVFQ